MHKYFTNRRRSVILISLFSICASITTKNYARYIRRKLTYFIHHHGVPIIERNLTFWTRSKIKGLCRAIHVTLTKQFHVSKKLQQLHPFCNRLYQHFFRLNYSTIITYFILQLQWATKKLRKTPNTKPNYQNKTPILYQTLKLLNLSPQTYENSEYITPTLTKPLLPTNSQSCEIIYT